MKYNLPKTAYLLKTAKVLLSQMVILLLITNVSYAKSNKGSSSATGVLKHLNLIQPAAINIKGQVTDKATGSTLPGVTVKIKNTQIGVSTDVNGNYSINNVPDNATLVISYLGYVTSEVRVNGQAVIDVQLSPSAQNLNEVVVVGYGTQKKTSITGAVSTLPIKNITQKPVVNLTNTFVGRVSGLIATQGSGEPGNDQSNITIRGLATNGRTNPLTVVDGVPRDFSRLDPNTIETVTILKDAAAVAPYGVAGANGVILITTKAGKAGKPTLTYNGYFGIQNPTSVPRYVNSFEYATLRNEAAVNDANNTGSPLHLAYTDADLALFQNHQDPDGHADARPLEDIIKRNRPIQYHNITLSGGTEDIKYFASLGYNRQDGMWDPTYLNKYNGSLSVTANATKTTTVNLRVNSYEEDQHFPGKSAGDIIGLAQRQNPTFPLRYSNGLPSGYIGASLYGEVYNSGYALNKNTALLTQLSIEQKLPIKGLSLKGVFSYDNGPDPLGYSQNQSTVQRTYTTPIPFTNPRLPAGALLFQPGVNYVYTIGYQGDPKPSLREMYGENKMFTYQGLLNYTGSFGKSDITAVGVVEYRTVNWQNFTVTRKNYNLDIDELDFGGPLPTDVTVGGNSGGQKQLGYVYRIGYSYDNKYLFEASGRYDGSYLFSPGHRFGFFPAFSAGWRISEEKFIKDNFTWIDNLKLRASYGQSGNYPNGTDIRSQYQYLSQFQIVPTSGVIGGNATQGISENLQGNAGITWEKSNKTDVGFEGSFWKGALGIEADYFYEKRSNLLADIAQTLPSEYGVPIGQINGGSVSNHGVELTLTTFKNFSNDLRLDVKGTFTYARSKVLQLFENALTFNNPNRRITGRPLGEQFGLKALGYFTADDFTDGRTTLKPGIPVPNFGPVHPGDIKYADLSGPNGVPDGKVDVNDNTDIGHAQTPQIIYGLEPRLTYKNFDLDLLIQGSGLSNIALSNYYVFPFVASGSATELVYQDHWTPSTPNARYPEITGTPSSNNQQVSTWFLRNDSYIRLKSAELGYTFSKNLLGHTIQSLRIYAAGQNLFFLTPSMKETVDPENSGNNQNYYQQRVLSFGLNATF